ncbi:PepSY-associated TM helix domain-containing protein [Aridibaculum aurantiacum]|uniref:PepSY-associated TM helix domain-containing protein n=1 Tax=Aridibaculum aurantiacum TaxID=2810307 RepID=UPI001A95A79A|nr:PepSY-associated TM helix domain-containing protein [Aridibaculum aurantiacum]
MKKFFRNIHLYLSLAAGLVILTCCFTGAVLVFEKELQEAFNHDRYYVTQQEKQLPIEQMIANVKQQYPKAKVSSVKLYPDPARSVEIGVTIPSKEDKEGKKGEGKKAETSKDNNAATPPVAGGKGKQAGPPAGGGRPTHTAFVNPYTGQVIELYSYRETFFYTMFALHRWLLGSDSSIGKTITGVSTLIFLVILITGIILWWPKNKAILLQRLKLKTSGSFKRINHDMHVVLGFYSSIFLFIFAFTALAWSFKWFNKGIYTVTNSSMEAPKPPQSAFVADQSKITYDAAFSTISKVAPGAVYYTLRAPSDSTGIFTATVLPAGVMETASDSYYIDQYSGQVIGTLAFNDKNLGQRVRSAFKPVHTGSIYGLPSKVIAFIVCLLGASFPITGVIMWINRLKKKKRKAAEKKLQKVPELSMEQV